MKNGLLRAVSGDGGAIGRPEVIFWIVIPDSCGKEQEAQHLRKVAALFHGASEKIATSGPRPGPRPGGGRGPCTHTPPLCFKGGEESQEVGTDGRKKDGKGKKGNTSVEGGRRHQAPPSSWNPLHIPLKRWQTLNTGCSNPSLSPRRLRKNRTGKFKAHRTDSCQCTV